MLLSPSQTLLLILVLTSLLTSELEILNIADALATPSQEQIKPSSQKLPKDIATSVLKDAAHRSRNKIAHLHITQATPKTFSNNCVFKFGEICTQQYQPIQGWLVHVKVNHQSWTYHAKKINSHINIVLDPKNSPKKSPKKS
jgi:hypothetical protein